MRFAKGHGTHNDFVVLLDPDGSQGLSQDLAARLCDRRGGIGADGVLRAVLVDAAGPLADGPADSAANGAADAATARAGDGRAKPPEWFMDYRNADGTVAEMCGNGVRVLARYLTEHALVSGPEFSLATRAGVRAVTISAAGDITVDMGPAILGGPGRAVVGGQDCAGLRVSVGNPHLACLVDAPLGGYDLTMPPALDPTQFPAGANVELVQLTGAGSVAMRVYERGSAETRSCGTGAVAAAVAAQHAHGPACSVWQVTVPGGQLTVEIGAETTWLTGPAVIVAEGDLAPGWLTARG